MHTTKHITSTLTKIGPWSGIAAVIVFSLSDITLSIATPDYDALGETTSQLMNADARYSLFARSALGIYCILIIPFILSTVEHLQGNQTLNRLRASVLWLHLLASIAAVSFQNESQAIVTSGITVNEIHDRAGEVLYAAALIAITATAIAERTNGNKQLLWTSIFAATTMAATGLGLYLQSFPELTGLEERLGLAAYIAWVITVARFIILNPINRSLLPRQSKENRNRPHK